MSQSVENAGSPVEASQSVVQPQSPVGSGASGGGAVNPPCSECANAKVPCVRKTKSSCVRCALKHRTCNLGGRTPKTYKGKGKGSVHQAELSKAMTAVSRIRSSLQSQMERTVDKVEEGKITQNQIPVILEHITEDLDEQLRALHLQIKKLKEATS